jgi:tetratricopeptide (TPR) repeat protein
LGTLLHRCEKYGGRSEKEYPDVKLSTRLTRMLNRSLFFALVVRALVVCACLLGIWESWKTARSDALFLQGTAESVRASIRLEPDCWWCYTQLARLDESSAEELLQTSLRLNPYNSEAAIDLGLRYESDGEFHRAEELLFQAFEVDRTYETRWSLANFYFRRDNLPAFWMWIRRATEMPADDIGALFELCWRVSPDPKTIEANIVEDNPDVVRQYIVFLIGKDQPAAAVNPALTLLRTGTGSQESDQSLLFTLLDKLIAANDANDANTLWNRLIRQHWIVADTSFPNNPQFSRDPLPVDFDWTISAYSGLHSWSGSFGLETEFTGDEPESCAIAEQTISLPPGDYRLESSYRTRNILPDTGIQWQIVEAKSDKILASSGSLSSDTPARVVLPFSVGPDEHLLRLRLAYHRNLGTPRVSGTVVVTSVRIQSGSSS